jgi:hypothetical protein
LSIWISGFAENNYNFCRKEPIAVQRRGGDLLRRENFTALTPDPSWEVCSMKRCATLQR